jgi:hypothetical protein
VFLKFSKGAGVCIMRPRHSTTKSKTKSAKGHSFFWARRFRAKFDVRSGAGINIPLALLAVFFGLCCDSSNAVESQQNKSYHRGGERRPGFHFRLAHFFKWLHLSKIMSPGSFQKQFAAKQNRFGGEGEVGLQLTSLDSRLAR